LTPPSALISFDLGVLLALAGDFFLVTRKSPRIFSPWGPAALVLLLAAHAILVTPDSRVGRGEFVLIQSTVAFLALFAYYNMVAFIKRGVTFSILLNHARPARERRDDREFIDLELRLREMVENGWALREGEGYRLTRTGAAVAALTRLALRLLRADQVG